MIAGLLYHQWSSQNSSRWSSVNSSGAIKGGIAGVKFSYWAKCNLRRMDKGGIQLNFIRLVFGKLKFNLIKLVSEEKTIPNLVRPPPDFPTEEIFTRRVTVDQAEGL